jgi:hypothetical protein
MSEIFRTDYLTVYSGKSEVIVYGDGSNWIVQYSNVTNPVVGWRQWFWTRELAEEDAKTLSESEYCGRRV